MDRAKWLRGLKGSCGLGEAPKLFRLSSWTPTCSSFLGRVMDFVRFMVWNPQKELQLGVQACLDATKTCRSDEASLFLALRFLPGRDYSDEEVHGMLASGQQRSLSMPRDPKGSFEGDIDMDVDVEVESGRCIYSLYHIDGPKHRFISEGLLFRIFKEGFNVGVGTAYNGIEAVMVLTSRILR